MNYWRLFIGTYFLMAGTASADNFPDDFNAETQAGMICEKVAEQSDYDITREQCYPLATEAFKTCSEKYYSEIITKKVKASGITEQEPQQLLAYATYRLQVAFCLYQIMEVELAGYKKRPSK